jgi:putative DNA primase/helicase
VSENTTGNAETRRAAARYLRAGLVVIPVPAGSKNPNRPGWQDERWAVKDVPKLWDNGQGIGMLWGEPSHGQVDLDLDWPEAVAVARYLLPDTRTFGRPGAPASHRIYRATGTIPKTKRYKVPGQGEDRSVVELLSTGAQSLIPPSLHDSGERRQWYEKRNVYEIDGADLIERVRDVATAALLVRNWPGRGARHDYVNAATGYLARRKLAPERVERIMRAAIYASGDEEADGRQRSVADTLDKVANGLPATGGPTLDQLAPGVSGTLRGWWGWGGDEPEPDSATGHTNFRLTDLGNGERLVARHGGDLRYVHLWKKWLVWDGRRWEVDASGEVERRAVQAVRAIYSEAENAHDDNARKAIARWAMTSETRSRVEAMIALARSMPGIPVKPEELDADPWLLNVENGVINLRTGELREHRREDLITKLAPVEYDTHADAPRFVRFLAEIFRGDQGVISFVRRFAGYALTGSTEERVFAILYGRGKNGKTTLIELLRDVMGDYAQNTDAETILQKDYRGVGNEVAALCGARFVSAAEVEQGRYLAESKVKNLTGSDTVTARFLFSEPFDFKPQFKLWLSTNNKPVIRGTDDAIWDRIRLIPFEQRFTGERRDQKLPEKLREEMPGVLSWMVEGCLEWQREGLDEPEKVKTATEVYRTEMDTLAAFIEECCVTGSNAWVEFKALYEAYGRWCAESNEHAEKKRRFADLLTERGYEKGSGSKNVAIRKGIALRHDGDPDPSRVNDPEPNPEPDPPSDPPEQGEFVNRVNELPENVNPQNTCKTAGSGERVNEGYRKNENFGLSEPREGEFSENVNLVNLVNPEPVSDAGAASPETPLPRKSKPPLTPEQVARYRRLISEGMSREWALASVRGEEVTL